MTKRRRLFLVSACIAMGAVVYGMALWLTGPGHCIHEESLQLIQLGMTQADVEEILGGPPGDYFGHKEHFMMFSGHPGLRTEQWFSEAFAIDVYFDGAGKVQKTWGREASIDDQSLSSKIRRWLGSVLVYPGLAPLPNSATKSELSSDI